MATVSSMILRSLRLLGEKAPGDTLTANEQTDYLYDLNSMMESWQTERLMCYQVLQESFSLVASTATYTIGSGGALNTTRPTKIVDPCFIRDSSNLDTPVRLIPVDIYGKFVQKSGNNSYPQYLYYDQGFSATSTASLNLYPPPQGGLTLFINSLKTLQNFANISTTVLLPPGYQRAIEFNFAVEEAGGFINVSPEVAKIAKESKAAVKGINLPDTLMRLDAGIVQGRRMNIIEGP